MLTEPQLIDLLTDLESDRVERTVSTTKTDKFGEAICAFSNDLPGHGEPGYLLIGVQDDGTLSGLKVTDELLKNLGAIRSDGNILPQPAMSIARFVLEGGEVAVVEVLPSDLPPLRYKGRVWIRVGPRRALANEQEERILSERRVALARSETPDDQAEISGDLFSVLKELEGRVRLLIQTTMRPTEGFGEKLYAFADHVEIQSPGGLYGEATPENFPTRNSYRNPIIAEAMKSLGFVNRFGYGVQRAQALLEKNGNPPASYAFDDRSVLVKVYRRQP